MTAKHTLWVIASFVGVAVVVAIFGINAPMPADWVIGWTTYLASVVGTVVAVRTLWVGADLLKLHIETTIRKR